MTMNTLVPGVPTKSLDAATVAAAGTTFAMPHVGGNSNNARNVSWRTSIGGTAVTVDADLQGAMNNVEAEFADIDTSTHLTGEYRTVTNVLVNFIRIKLNTLTAGAAPTFTGEILI